jgi:RHS repeat-associated protein
VTTLLYSDGTSTSGPTGGVFDGTTKTLHAGYLLSATDFRGRALQFTYNSNTNISKITDSAGNVYQFQYDIAGNLWKVIYPGTGSPTRTYVYNESANTSSADLPYALTGINDENNARFATYQYLADGRAKTTTYAGGANNYSMTYGTGTVTWTDPLGTSRTSTLSRIQGVSVVTGTTQTCTGCGGTTTETFEYDANRNQTSHKDFNGNLSCFAFDARRLETARTEGLSGTGTCAARVTTPATRTITTEWQPVQRLMKRKAEPLRITTLAYNGDPGVSCAPTGASTELVCSRTVQATTDLDGHLAFTATSDGAARVWAYTYNVSGQVLTIDGPRTDVSDVTTYTYYSTNDPSGNYKTGDLASMTNALSQVTQFTQYDGMGRLKKMIDLNGLETIVAYSPRGWLVSKQVGTASSGYETTAFEYDSVGELKKVTQPDASYVSYTYDDAHRLTQIQDGLGHKIVYTLDAMGNRTAESAFDITATLVRTHTRVMDALNRVKQEIGGTNPTTQITQQSYDGNGNLTTITDPLSRVTTQIFDARNRLTEVRDPFNGSGAPTKYEYNGLDQLTKVTDPASLATTYALNGHGELLTQVSPDTGTTAFTYDPASNLSTKLDARSISASYAYDALNRLTQITYPDETVAYTFDACANGVGRLCSITDNSGTTSYAFDVKGRITSKTQTVGSIARTMGYGYNAAGQLTTITTPSGKSVIYTYSNNRPVSVTVDGTPLLSAAFYEPFGPNGGWVWGNSTVSAPNTHTRIFDKDFRAKRITSDLPASGAQPYFDRQIGWDDQGRVTSMTDLANSALNAAYGYDALDRLTSATQGSSSWGYTYSGVGDRVTSTVNSSTTNYGYTSGTHRLQSLSGAQTKSYTVDAAGNMTSDGATTWTYGGNNRPAQAGTTNFLINALGQRVKKVTGSATTLFAYDEAGRLWGEYDGAGSLVAETIWLDALPVAVIKSGPSYVHPDHLGTPRLVTRPSDNAILWRWDNTEAFGNSQPNENPSGIGTFAYNLRFPGQYFDIEMGTHYNYFRDYDASIGRYIESDPIGRYGGLNTFGYVNGGPLRRRDPLGLTAADVQGVFRDVGSSFSDLSPNGNGVGFQPMKPGFSGGTDWSDGQIWVDPSWAKKTCLSRSEYEDLFFTLFHEAMHSSDNVFRRFLTTNSSDDEHHNSIYRRELYERDWRPRWPGGDMWGTPRPDPVNIDRRYEQYRARTPACCPNK